MLWVTIDRMENENKLVQMRFLDTGVGLGNICESDWTRFAKEKPAYIGIRTLTHRGLGKNIGTKPFYKKTQPFMKNSWTEFAKRAEMSVFDCTIQNYKNTHQGARPDWARLYPEKASFGENRILNPDDSEYQVFWRVEKEIYLMKDSDVTVMRFADANGSCQRVLVIQDGKNAGHVRVRQEDKISKAQWRVTKNVELPREEAVKLIII